MQLTTLLLLIAAVSNAVSGQYYQQGTQQYYQQPQSPPQQQYNQWQRWQQPQYYPPQQPQQPQQPHYYPPQQPQQPPPPQQPQQPQQPQYFAQSSAQMTNQPNVNVYVPSSQQQQQVYQQFSAQQPQMTQYQPLPQQQFQPQVQSQASVPSRYVPDAIQSQSSVPSGYVPEVPQVRPNQQQPQPSQETIKSGSLHHQQARIYRQQFRISKPSPTKVSEPQQPGQRLDIHQRIRVPPPPGRFVPHLADIYGQAMPDRPYTPPKFAIISSTESLPDGLYEADEKNENGVHRSYIEDTAKTSPVKKIGRVSKPKAIKPTPEAQLRIREIPTSEIRRPSHTSRPISQQFRNSTSVHTINVPKSSFVKTIPKLIVPATGSKNPNTAFLTCCKAAKVAKSCERICNFDILNKKVLTGMFLGTDPCPQSYGLDLLQCAAQSEDHTECCQDRGVHTTTAGNKCLGFCNMRPGVNFQADVSMLPCWGVLHDIKSCFKDHIERS